MPRTVFSVCGLWGFGQCAIMVGECEVSWKRLRALRKGRRHYGEARRCAIDAERSNVARVWFVWGIELGEPGRAGAGPKGAICVANQIKHQTQQNTVKLISISMIFWRF